VLEGHESCRSHRVRSTPRWAVSRPTADRGNSPLDALGRFGRINEIAEILAFCAGDKPGYLTGVDILVDGGADARMTIRDTLAMARQVR
jgi:NAD(P)-dependent dehydrogenase (short-subunit alcohol dehydrogenase family)